MSFEQNYNDKHFKYSIAKSIIRMASCFIFLVALTLALCDVEMSLKTFIILWGAMPFGFFIAEILGIMEENI